MTGGFTETPSPVYFLDYEDGQFCYRDGGGCEVKHAGDPVVYRLEFFNTWGPWAVRVVEEGAGVEATWANSTTP